MSNSEKVPYQKTPKTFKEQISLLKSRGLIIDNEDKAEKILTFVSYNRLSNYWHLLLREPKSEEIFKPDSHFETAFRLYKFDSDLRTFTFQAIEQIEIAVRTQIIYHFSHKYKTGFWFKNDNAFKSFPYYIKLLEKLAKGTQETKQEFIVKYNKTYTQYLPPSWKSFELLTFRTLLDILKNISDHKDIIPISQSFGLNHTVLISWLECIVYIRNICAHHGRLWNRKLTIKPTRLKNPNGPWLNHFPNDRFYAGICIILYLLEKVNPYNKFGKRLLTLIDRYDFIELASMGFPTDWENQDLWKAQIDKH